MIVETTIESQEKIVGMIKNSVEKENILMNKLGKIRHLRSCKYWRHKSCQCRVLNLLEYGYDVLLLSPNIFDEAEAWKIEWNWMRYDIRLDIAIDALDKYLDPVNTSRLGWFMGKVAKVKGWMK